MKKFSCGLCHALCTQRVQWRSLYKQERLQVPQNSCHGVVGRRGIIITWPMRHYRPCWAPGEHEACSCMRKQWKKIAVSITVLTNFQFCNDRAYNRPCMPSSMKDPMSLGINTNLWHITEAHGYVLEDSDRYEILRKLAVQRTWYRELRANIMCFEASNLLLLAW